MGRSTHSPDRLVPAERRRPTERRVLRRGSRITAASPAEDLDDLRKRCKELRYLLEIFIPLLDPADARGAVRELKALQGRARDVPGQRGATRGDHARATDMMARGGASVRTILAMGEIAARLHEDQHSSRAKFAATFERFARRSVQDLMARLGRAAAAPTEAATTASAGPAR
jgi:CHAD domain